MKYCCEDVSMIENYELAKKDDFKGWVCHHRLETHTSEGERRLVDISKEELKALGMYYRRPSEELIYLTKSEHQKLHRKGGPGPNSGKHFSEDHKRKIAESNRGKKHFKGLFCIDIYDGEGNLKVEEYIIGVSMRDLFNDLKAKSDAGNFNIDCSNDLVFRKKARAGRDVKLTSNETNVALYARIRELEKRVKVLEAEVKELKEFKEEATEEIKEIKEKVERFDNLDELVAKTTIKTLKKMLYNYCAAERNNLTYEKVKEWGLIDAFLLALRSKAITKAVDGDYYFVHWDEIKNL